MRWRVTLLRQTGCRPPPCRRYGPRPPPALGAPGACLPWVKPPFFFEDSLCGGVFGSVSVWCIGLYAVLQGGCRHVLHLCSYQS